MLKGDGTVTSPKFHKSLVLKRYDTGSDSQSNKSRSFCHFSGSQSTPTAGQDTDVNPCQLPRVLCALTVHSATLAGEFRRPRLRGEKSVPSALR